mgnify:FL=1
MQIVLTNYAGIQSMLIYLQLHQGIKLLDFGMLAVSAENIILHFGIHIILFANYQINGYVICLREDFSFPLHIPKIQIVDD